MHFIPPGMHGYGPIVMHMNYSVAELMPEEAGKSEMLAL